MPCACQVPVPKYPDTADWGPILWTILHGLAERAGRAPLPEDERRSWQRLIKATGEMLPCDKCRAHYSAFLQANPVTQLDTLPFAQIKMWVRSWFYTLHNEVNVENNKEVFAYEDLEATYSISLNFQDLFWRLEPILKRAIDLSGVPLLRWLNWVKEFKMLRAAMGV